MANIVKEEMKQLNYEDIAALVTTGAAAGIAVTKITGHSKTLGAVAGVGISLVLYGFLNRSRK